MNQNYNIGQESRTKQQKLDCNPNKKNYLNYIITIITLIKYQIEIML